MFVINANKQQDWFIISNSQLWMYPDYKGSLFLSLDTLRDVAINSTPSSITAIETIGWTNINRYSPRFIMPDYLIGVSGSGIQPIGILCNDTAHSGNYTPVTIRVWLENWFNWGEVVGENIVWWGVVGMLASGSNYGYGRINSIKFTAQLLHSDWTLTEIAERILLSQEVSWWTDLWEIWTTRPGNTTVHYGYTDKLFIPPVKTTQTWKTAAVWDRLVLDIYYNWKITNATTSGCGLFFGYKYSPDDTNRFMPTQVSIR